MSVVRCDRCDSWIDLDWNCEGMWNDETGEFTCWECMTPRRAGSPGG